MEIKRRLNAIAKCMTPDIECMNIADEMRRMLTRFEELVAYADEKAARAKERAARGGKTKAQISAERRAADAKEIRDHQQAELEINQADQKEAYDERNKDPGMVGMEKTEHDPGCAIYKGKSAGYDTEQDCDCGVGELPKIAKHVAKEQRKVDEVDAKVDEVYALDAEVDGPETPETAAASAAQRDEAA